MASKLTDLKIKTMERKKILEMLTGHCAGVASTKENGLVATKVYLDDLADELVNLFAIHGVVESACDDYAGGINMQCSKCDQPKYKH
jgi:hypothetical protein